MRRTYISVILVLVAALLLVLIHDQVNIPVIHGRTIRYPSQLLLEDFQSPLDRDLSETMLKIENTGLPGLFEEIFLKPLVDDPTELNLCVKAVQINEQQQPVLFEVLKDCARILSIPCPLMYIADLPGINALTTNFHEPIIILHSTLVRRCDDKSELRFIIGHECGHIKCRHVRCQMVLRTILHSFRSVMGPDVESFMPFLLPVLKFAREAEFSADNAGLVCSQDISAAEQALCRLVTGLDRGSVGEINVESFLRQRTDKDFSRFSEALLLWQELTSEHPYIPDRIKQLRHFFHTRYPTIMEAAS